MFFPEVKSVLFCQFEYVPVYPLPRIGHYPANEGSDWCPVHSKI